AALDLKPGQEIAPPDLADLLIDAGFVREDPADEHGEFAVRGGIVDIFPAGDARPVRLEFVGDTIESLRQYDPSTQRSVEALDQVSVVPLLDVLAAPSSSTGLDRSATILDYMRQGAPGQIVVSEWDEIEAHVTKLLEQLHQSYDEALHRKQRAPSPSDLFV